MAVTAHRSAVLWGRPLAACISWRLAEVAAVVGLQARGLWAAAAEAAFLLPRPLRVCNHSEAATLAALALLLDRSAAAAVVGLVA